MAATSAPRERTHEVVLRRIEADLAAGRLAIGQAAYGEAEGFLGEAEALARAHGDPAGLAAVLNARGLLARAQDRYAASAQAYTEALGLARSAGNHGEEAAALGIVDRAVAEAEVLPAATALAASLAGHAGDTLGTIKERMYAPVLRALRSSDRPLE